MKISWNTLTLVLHGYVILSLVEVEFLDVETALCVETARETARGFLQGLRVDCWLLECCFCRVEVTGTAWV